MAYGSEWQTAIIAEPSSVGANLTHRLPVKINDQVSLGSSKINRFLDDKVLTPQKNYWVNPMAR